MGWPLLSTARCSQRAGAAGRAALHNERALHLSNALAGDVLLELGRGSRDLEDELAMRGLVVELAAECPELDLVAAEGLDEALLYLEVPPKAVLDLWGARRPHRFHMGDPERLSMGDR